MIRSKAVKDIKKKILRSAEELVAEKTEDRYVEDLTRTGVAWAGILDLTDPISPSEVAAMLCCHDLVRATRLVDSEEHWTSAAAYVALAAAAEPAYQGTTKTESSETKEVLSPVVGFVASAKSHEQ